MGLVNGIWEYDEGDAASPTFSELLNLLGDSVRDALSALEASIPATKVQYGTASLPINLAAGATGSGVPLTFPTPFAGLPRVTVQRAGNNSPISTAVWAVGPNGFTITPRNDGSTPVNATISFHWIAVYG